MSAEKCLFCKSEDRLSIRMLVRECWIQCRVCGAQGPKAKNSDDAWTYWLWAWRDEQQSEPPTMAAEVAEGIWRAGGETQPINLLREQVNTELLKGIDRRLDHQDADLRQIQGYVESTNYRLDDVQDSLDYLKSQLEQSDP